MRAEAAAALALVGARGRGAARRGPEAAVHRVMNGQVARWGRVEGGVDRDWRLEGGGGGGQRVGGRFDWN